MVDPCCVDPCSPACKSITAKCEAFCEGFGFDNPCCPPRYCDPECTSVAAQCEGDCYDGPLECCDDPCSSECTDPAAKCEAACTDDACDNDQDDPDDDEDNPRKNHCNPESDQGDGLFMRITTGNVWASVPALRTYANDEIELELVLRYDSQRAGQDGPVGYGWAHSYNVRLDTSVPNKVIYCQGHGRRNAFIQDQQTGMFAPPKGRAFDLVWVGDHFELNHPDGSKEVFDAAHHLTETIDRRGRATRLLYGANGRVSQVISQHGRVIKFDYNGETRLLSVTAPDGTQTTFEYTAAGNLTRITDPLLQSLEYDYDAEHRLTRETLKNGTFYTAEYEAGTRTIRDGQGCVVTQVTAGIGLPATRSTPITPGMLVFTDGRGLDWQVRRDSLGRLREIIAPSGATRKYIYGNPLSKTQRNRLIGIENERGFTRAIQWDTYGNVIRRMDEAGHEEQSEYSHPDIASLLTRRIEPDGDEWAYEYAANGDLTRVIDPLDEREQGTAEDAVTALAYETYAAMEDVGTSGLSLPGRIKQITMTSRNGHDIIFDYDPRGNLSTVTRGAGTLDLVTHYEYDAMGRQTRRITVRGDTTIATTWSYDAIGRLLTVVENPGGLELTEAWEYDAYGNLTRRADARGIPTVLDYDPRNRLTRRTEAEGTLELITRWELDDNGNVLLRADPENHVTEYNYNSQNQLEQILDAQGHKTFFRRDPIGNVTRIERGLEPGMGSPYEVTEFVYDPLDRLTSRTVAPESFAFSTTYDYDAPSGCDCAATPGARLPHKITDPAGKVTYLDFDRLDRLVAVIRKVGDVEDDGGDEDDAVSRFEYDPEGNITAAVGPEGERVEYVYDAADRRTQLTAIEPIGGDLVMTLAYDGSNNVRSATLPNGNTVTLLYDSADRLTSASDSVGLLVSYVYDPAGNVLARADGLGRVWRYAYDPAGRLTRAADPIVESPQDLVTGFAYDGVGRLTERVNPLGVLTRYAYDGLGRLTRLLEDADGQPSSDTADTATSYVYDGAGRVVSLIDPDDNQTDYWHDQAGRLEWVVYPDELGGGEGTVWLGHDAAGNLISRADQNGVLTSYTYNDLHRLTERVYTYYGLPLTTETFTYDRSGRLTQATGDVGERLFAFDAVGRLTRAEQELAGLAGGAYATTFGYQIDPSVTRRAIGYPGGRVVVEDYDRRYRLAGVSSPGLGTVATWAYDAADQRVSAVLGNGVAGAFGFDPAGRLTSLRHAKNAADLFHVEHGWDAGGNPTFKRDLVDPTQSELYRHDARDRLREFQRGTLNAEGTDVVTPTPSAYLPQSRAWDGLDRRGNWLASTTTIAGQVTTDPRTANAVNEYLTRDPDGLGPQPPTALTHNANGNLTDDGTWSYTYDEANRLAGVTPVGAAEPTLEIEYDALGSRVHGTNATGTETFHIYAAGPGVLEERSADGALLREFIYGAHFLRPLVLIDSTEAGCQPQGQPEPLYYLQDLLGSVVALTDSNGEAVERYTYDPYGTTYITDANSNALAASAFGNPLMWTGQRYDTDVSLYHFYFRSYSPTLGRWLHRDPLGYVDGVNLYEYVGSGPLFWFDPWGRMKVPWWVRWTDPILGSDYGTEQGRVQTILVVCEVAQVPADVATLGGGRLVKGVLKRAGRGALRAGVEKLGDRAAKEFTEKAAKELTEAVGKRADDIVGAVQKGGKATKAARAKGVREFWKQERERLLRGEKGSRDWTPEQKADILNGKRPKDAAGKTIEGHHELEVKTHPEEAANPENITPMTVKEHRGKGTGVHSKKPEGSGC